MTSSNRNVFHRRIGWRVGMTCLCLWFSLGVRLPAQTFTNDVRIYYYSFVLPMLTGSGLKVIFSTPDNNGRTFPLGTRTEGVYLYMDKVTGEVAPEEIGSHRFRTDFVALTSANQYAATGDASIFNVPVSVDANQDGFPDCLQWDQPGSFSCSGVISYWDYTIGSYQDRYPTLNFTRAKGSSTGSCAMRYSESGSTVTFGGNYYLAGYFGKTVINRSSGVYSSTFSLNLSPGLKSTFSAKAQCIPQVGDVLLRERLIESKLDPVLRNHLVDADIRGATASSRLGDDAFADGVPTRRQSR